jgi:hypothetical protein
MHIYLENASPALLDIGNLDPRHFVRASGSQRGLVMMRATAVALAILGSCDFLAFGGRYTAVVMQILAAIEHSFV